MKRLLTATAMAGLLTIGVTAAQAATYNPSPSTGALCAAVATANASPGPDTIQLSDSGFAYDYDVCDSTDADGDYDIDVTSDITILGNSGNPSAIEIDGGDDHRIFDVHGGATLDVSGVQLEFAAEDADGGSAIRVRSGGTLFVHAAIFTDSFPRSDGGALLNEGTAHLFDVLIERNSAQFKYGLVPSGGGGIYNSGSLFLTDVQIHRNHADGDGGGLYNAGTASLVRTSITGNSAGGIGPDIRNTGTITGAPSPIVDETASGFVFAGGTLSTDGESDGATSNDPLETAVTTPVDGTVEIVESSGSGAEFSFAGLLARISAPVATVANPLVIAFTLDSSVVPAGLTSATLPVYRDGVLIVDCPGSTAAAPDPCVSNRANVGDDIVLTVLSSHASDWTFTAPAAPPVPPSISVADATVVEGTGGTTLAVFTVTRSGDLSGTSTVGYATLDGSAFAPADYASASGTLTFGPGDAVRQVTVQVVADATVEPDEGFTLVLSSPSNATLGDAVGQGTIVNDDVLPPPTLSIGDVTVVEGTGGTTPAVFTVTRSGDLSGTSTVGYATVDGSALAPADYASASGTLTFGPGDAVRQVTVQVVADATVEPDEGFTLVLSSPSNATLGDAVGQGTIVNDDVLPPPVLSIGDVTVVEGDSGTQDAVLTVTRSGDLSRTSQASYSTANGSAAAPGDYVATSGTVTFAAGQSAATIHVPVVGDEVSETDETFSVDLTAATGATIADGHAVVTIEDDDEAPLPGVLVRVHGHGALDTADNVRFKLKAGFAKDGSPRGKVDVSDRDARMHLRGSTLTNVTCTGTSAVLRGSGTVGGRAVTFRVDVVDGGGKKAGVDTFAIQIAGGGTYSAAGSLRKGDIKLDCR